MRRWFSRTIVLISSLAVGPLGGCALDELAGSSSEADESLGSVSQETHIIIARFLMIAGRTDGERRGGRTVGAGTVTEIVEVAGPTVPHLVIHLEALPEYKFVEVHAAPAQDIPGLPFNPAGCPQLGLFPESASFPVPVSSFDLLMSVENVNLLQPWLLAVHGVVMSEDGATESAWGEGDDLESCDSPAMVVPVPPLDPIPGIALARGDE